MNQTAKEIKKFKPIQSSIMKFFALRTWEETTDKFGNDMCPEHLSRFLVSSFRDRQAANEAQI